jgi:hypothetical protein
VGIYLYSVDALDWFGPDEDGLGHLAVALNAELARRGLPPYDTVPDEAPFVRGSGTRFEEKLVPPMDDFTALCRAHLSSEEAETLYGWTALVPASLEPEIRLPPALGTPEQPMIAGAPQALPLAERLAGILELPDQVPATNDNLDLTSWFMDGPAKRAGGAAARTVERRPRLSLLRRTLPARSPALTAAKLPAGL